MSEIQKFRPEIQEQRDELAHEIRGIRKKRDKKIKQSAGVTSKIFGTGEKLQTKAEGLNELAIDRLAQGRAAIARAEKNYESRYEILESGSTDHNLIQWFYKRFRDNAEAHAIATDSFIDRSRNEYNASWLARELTQNFVDHNPKDPGTLNGVKIEVSDVPGSPGTKRFIITGNWPYEDPTGVISPHSEKRADMNTAGGNGIGLKQAAIRYLRDFDVSKFQIQGEGWEADYELAKADDINKQIEQTLSRGRADPVVRKMRHDWLVASLKPTENTGKVRYIIETSDPQVIASLEQLKNIGVSEQNDFLQQIDFQNKHGAIKWMLPKAGKTQFEEVRGRLFINGQVMNYGSKGQGSDNYWVGPEYLTLRLNNINYQMSIDRPPISSYELTQYAAELVKSMSVAQIIEQLKRSEPIWSTVSDRFSSKGAFVLFSAFISKLRFSQEYKKSDFAKYFTAKKYLARDVTLTEAQEKDLIAQGYTLCDENFEAIGMQKASSRLSKLDTALNQSPSYYSMQSGIEKLAQESGMPIAHEDLGALGPEQLFEELLKRLKGTGFEIESDPNKPNKVRVKFHSELPKKLVFHALANPKTDQQKLLFFLRGFIFQTLKQKIVKNIYSAQGEFVSTYALHKDPLVEEDVLIVRNIETATDGGFIVEFELAEAHADLKNKILGSKNINSEIVQPNIETDKTVPEVKPEPEVKENRFPKRQTGSNVRDTQIVEKKTETPLSPQQQKDLEEKLPGITVAIQDLQLIADKVERQRKKQPIDKYKEWKDSADANHMAESNAGYMTGTILADISSRYNEAPIAIAIATTDRSESLASRRLKDLQRQLESIVKRVNPDGEVQDFEMVFEPESRQLSQLGLLRIYTYLTTGARIENRLFIFKGTGVRAINMGREAIGLHETELDQSFLEAVGAFTHELAHNDHMDHGPGFMTTMQGLFLEMQKKLRDIAAKANSGQSLTEDEESILSLQDKWDQLRTKTG